jgi:hypothetical protein
LIGHATMVEAHTEDSLVSFARVARNCGKRPFDSRRGSNRSESSGPITAAA